MRVELQDFVGMQHSISSRDPKLIGAWFTEQANEIMTADSRFAYSCRIQVWPESEDEIKLLGNDRDRYYQFTQDDLLDLAERILDASKKLADLEQSACAL